MIELIRKLRFSQLAFEEILSLKRKDDHKSASQKLNIYDQDLSPDFTKTTSDFCQTLSVTSTVQDIAATQLSDIGHTSKNTAVKSVTSTDIAIRRRRPHLVVNPKESTLDEISQMDSLDICQNSNREQSELKEKNL